MEKENKMAKQIQYTLPLRSVCALIPEQFRTSKVRDIHSYYGRAAREVATAMDDDGNFTRGRISGRVIEVEYSKQHEDVNRGLTIGNSSSLNSRYQGEIYLHYHKEIRSLGQFVANGRKLKLTARVVVDDMSGASQ
jgi:hypothetical protein